MIITVTMNPAIDKTVEVERLKCGELNRIRRTELDVGGKGINVSKTIQALGERSTATGFLAGDAGKRIEKKLKEQGIATDFIFVEGETRTNTKVVDDDGTLTELNEPGPVIAPEQIEAFLKKLESYADEDAVFVLAGSIPKGVTADIYRKIIALVKKRGARVLLDADGEAFRLAVEAAPDLVKPNRAELAQYTARCKEAALVQEGIDLLLAKGVGTVILSMGADGALFADKDERLRCPGLPVETHSAVGAGDAMAASAAYAMERGWTLDRTARLAMAASAGAVTTVGTKPPTRETVETLMKKVTVVKASPLRERLGEFEAVIFDMDGTLVDSMWMWYEIDVEYLARFGIEPPPDLQSAIEGMSFSETAQHFKERFGIPDDTEKIKADWNEMAGEKYRTQVPFKKGALEFLQKCKRLGLKLGVATSNSRELVENVAKALSLWDYMDDIITSCEVSRGKPAPDVYLAEADRLGVRPKKCLVFEDILAGIRAGKAAGMTVCGVEDAYSADVREEKIRESDSYIMDYTELL